MMRTMLLLTNNLFVPESTSGTSMDLCISSCIWMYSCVETTDGITLKQD